MTKGCKQPAEKPEEKSWGAFGSCERAASALYELLVRCGLADLILE
jgi:hypothetical protein